jgi:hypothetical protein
VEVVLLSPIEAIAEAFAEGLSLYLEPPQVEFPELCPFLEEVSHAADGGSPAWLDL